MKVCVYGAGAIGAHIAVLMKLAGVDVSVVARGANLEAIQANGLKLIIDGEERWRGCRRSRSRPTSARRISSSSR